MKTITRSIITLSDIPKEFHNHKLLKRQRIHTYIECHLPKKSKEPDDELTAWLRKTYPNLSKKICFLIHINI